MIPVLLAVQTWLTSFALITWGLQTAQVAFVACSFAIFLAIKRQKRLVVAATISFSVLSSLFVGFSYFSATADSASTNLTAKSYEIVDARVQLESPLAKGFWQGVLTEVDSKSVSVNVLVSANVAQKLEQGCTVSGKMRLIPMNGKDRVWLLKLAPRDFTQQCSRQSPLVSLRKNFLQNLRGPTQDSRALVAGLSVGDTSLLSDNAKAQMKALSLTHLTAVSGANCAIVLGLVFFCLSRLSIRRWLRTLLSVFALALYLELVGPQPSVLRAAFMSLCILLMVTAGRSIGPITALSWATLLLLWFNPFFASDYGFALSVAATGGILVMTPWLFRVLRTRFPTWIAAGLSVSAAAQLWCAPILLQLQGGIPTYSLLANSLVEPLVFPITVLGLFSCLLCLISPGLAGAVSWLASLPAFLIISVVHRLSHLPLLTLWWPSGVLGTLLMVGLVLALTLRALDKRVALANVIAIVSAFTLFFVGSVGFFKASSWPLKNWQIVNCDVGQGDALLIRSENHVALVDVGRNPEPIDACLNRLGIKQLDLLVLTHFDADHVGGLSGALAGRHIEVGMVTDYPDNRSQAMAITDELRRASDRLVSASAGLTGHVGAIKWLVLQPEHHGEGSEDPNDGSITMRWNAQTFTLFTMADLGEKGQMRLVQLHPDWINVDKAIPVVLKVSHHGSADQFPELIEALNPQVAIISVGKGNPYGHPTRATLKILRNIGSNIFRTDQNGPISVGVDESSQSLSVGTEG